ncbi:hypothetical protein H0H92_013381 [Tricholoma furcatifolium]|nr:hypothetical protein H0H92_013381 [Tricholoma furcatifolium]
MRSNASSIEQKQEKHRAACRKYRERNSEKLREKARLWMRRYVDIECVRNLSVPRPFPSPHIHWWSRSRVCFHQKGSLHHILQPLRPSLPRDQRELFFPCEKSYLALDAQTYETPIYPDQLPDQLLDQLQLHPIVDYITSLQCYAQIHGPLTALARSWIPTSIFSMLENFAMVCRHPARHLNLQMKIILELHLARMIKFSLALEGIDLHPDQMNALQTIYSLHLVARFHLTLVIQSSMSDLLSGLSSPNADPASVNSNPQVLTANLDTVTEARELLKEAEVAFEIVKTNKANQAKLKPGTKGAGKGAKKTVNDAYNNAKILLTMRQRQVDEVLAHQNQCAGPQNTEQDMVPPADGGNEAGLHVGNEKASDTATNTTPTFLENTEKTATPDLVANGNGDVNMLDASDTESDHGMDIDQAPDDMDGDGSEYLNDSTLKSANLIQMPVESEPDTSAIKDSGAIDLDSADLIQMPAEPEPDTSTTKDSDAVESEPEKIEAVIPNFFRNEKKQQAGSDEATAEKFEVAYEKMSQQDRDRVEGEHTDPIFENALLNYLYPERGRDAIEGWLEHPGKYRLDDTLRRLIRKYQTFIPEAAISSRQLALEILTTNRGNSRCVYHHRTDKTSKIRDGRGVKFQLYGVPEAPCFLWKKTSNTRKPAEGYLRCGCSEEDALLDFAFWKTWILESKGITEGLGEGVLSPRHRAFVLKNFRDYTGLKADDMYRGDLSDEEFERNQIKKQIGFLIGLLNDVCKDLGNGEKYRLKASMDQVTK